MSEIKALSLKTVMTHFSSGCSATVASCPNFGCGRKPPAAGTAGRQTAASPNLLIMARVEEADGLKHEAKKSPSDCHIFTGRKPLISAFSCS